MANNYKSLTGLVEDMRKANGTIGEFRSVKTKLTVDFGAMAQPTTDNVP